MNRETSVYDAAKVACRSGSHCLDWRNKRFVSSNYKANPLAARRRKRFFFSNIRKLRPHHAEILRGRRHRSLVSRRDAIFTVSPVAALRISLQSYSINRSRDR